MFSLAESRSDRLALRAALEPASSAAARLRSIWRRKSPLLTLSPSRTARFTTWPCTSADISTLFSAWILPLAVTLETMSWVATRAVRTGVAWLRLSETAAPAPNTSTPATMIQTRRLRRVNARQATPRPDQRQRVPARAWSPGRIRVRRERGATMKNPAILAAAVGLGALMTPVPSRAQLFTTPREQMIELTAQNPFERFPDGR